MGFEKVSVTRSMARGVGSAIPEYTLPFLIPQRGADRWYPGAFLRRTHDSGGVSVNVTPAIALDFAQEDERDTEFFDAIGSFNTRFKVLKAGRYRVNYIAQVEAVNSTASQQEVWISKNGSVTNKEACSISYTYPRASPTRPFTPGGAHSFVIDLAVNDYVELYIEKVGGGGAPTSVASETWFELECIRADDDQQGYRQLVPFDSVIDHVIITKDVSGSSGNTEVDILADGTSLLPTTKLTIGNADDSKKFHPVDFDEVNVDAEAELQVQVTGEETPPARGIRVDVVLGLRE